MYLCKRLKVLCVNSCWVQCRRNSQVLFKPRWLNKVTQCQYYHKEWSDQLLPPLSEEDILGHYQNDPSLDCQWASTSFIALISNKSGTGDVQKSVYSSGNSDFSSFVINCGKLLEKLDSQDYSRLKVEATSSYFAKVVVLLLPLSMYTIRIWSLFETFLDQS